MVDPIRLPSPSFSNSYPSTEKEHFHVTNAKEDTHGAEQVVVSLYGSSTQHSLRPEPLNEPTKAEALQIQENKVIERSLLGTMKNWLWGIIGWGQPEPAALKANDTSSSPVDEIDQTVSSTNPQVSTSSVPQLEKPASMIKQKLSKAVVELTQRLKEMTEFEEEMRKSDDPSKLIFLGLIYSNLLQKELKEEHNLLKHHDVQALHAKNKDLQKQHYDLEDAIQECNRKLSVVKWFSLGFGVAAIGGTIFLVASTGPLSMITAGTALASIGKGASEISRGIFSFQKDKDTGKLVIIKHEKQSNTSKKHEHIDEMQAADQAIGQLLKAIRQALKNQSTAERASFGRPS